MANDPQPETLSLFPLPTVLLPGATLGLRVFEPRYLDMVRECGRNSCGFGICLILERDALESDALESDALESDGPGNDARGEPGVHGAAAAYGTEALIEDFGTGDDGLLTLQVRGARRFHVNQVRVRDNGLQVARITWCEPDPVEPLRPEHGLLSTLLHGVIDRFGGEYAKADEARFDDAAWVGWRLAELLPLLDQQRQQLLQIDDPHERLDHLLALLPDEP
ncbi:ATP-dependent protease [Lysobacter concretionis Ko07 = DSM 16239]|uniref:ATP-dependent protease n=1 Tax=Lysobacter concretionis Ko07 = DSM 16239 TaxID=1122185 RepID=A0A0A0ELB2_9GAMM|nr:MULTISPECIES: LON peptidase substrate-binding domain-containing protein [Lysobacter]KGM50913.1 ATP-dependent protease [Lysobacter concretionis Ko07 = DSM 16239]QOD90701.1 LON peptidase substrate-binding domain-containing protein [Lysobacter sp. CW239]